MSILFFLSSGLFLGWSHGANNAGNVFGTAIGTHMVKFRTAAIVTSIFLILGSVISGTGAALTLGKLGAVNEIAGAFIVTLSTALAILFMTRFDLPVSTSQSVVGAIIGWNLFSGSMTDYNSLVKIVSSWVVTPFITGIFAVLIYLLVRFILNHVRIHLLILDFWNRIGLVVVGGFGAYSLGANNIANVMGVFVTVSPFHPINTPFGMLTGMEQLFILGGMAMASGVLTYSYKVMKTVGSSIIQLTPISALVVVFSSSFVLFLFSSQNLESFLASHGLPTIPLVPVSSAQAVVGALIGIGLLQGGRSIKFGQLGRIASGWVTAPIVACFICFISLYIFQNVFSQKVYKNIRYNITENVSRKLIAEGIYFNSMDEFINKEFQNYVEFKATLERNASDLTPEDLRRVIELAEIRHIKVDMEKIKYEIAEGLFTFPQVVALEKLSGKEYNSLWEFKEDLQNTSHEWKLKEDIPANRKWNRDVSSRIDYLAKKFWLDQ